MLHFPKASKLNELFLRSILAYLPANNDITAFSIILRILQLIWYWILLFHECYIYARTFHQV